MMMVLPNSMHKALHEVQDLTGRDPVEVTGGLISHQNRRVRHNSPGNGNPLLLASRELGGIMVHPVRQVHRVKGCLRVLPPLSLGKPVRRRGSSTFSKAVSTGMRL